jgi:hypothetical protein
LAQARRDAFGDGGALGHDRQLELIAEQSGEKLPHHDMIFDDDDARVGHGEEDKTKPA